MEDLCGRLNGCRGKRPVRQQCRERQQARLPRYLVERLLLDTTGYLEDVVLPSRRAGMRTKRSARPARGWPTAGCQVPAVEAMARYGWVGEMLTGVITRPRERPVTFGDRLDRLLTHGCGHDRVFC